MKQFLRVVLVSVVACAGVYAGGLFSQHALAIGSNQQAICESIGSGTDCNDNKGGSADVNSIIKTALKIFMSVVGVAAVVMVVVAGFKYVTSGGDSSKVASAKTTLIYALVGAAVAALAQVLVKFVLSKSTK